MADKQINAFTPYDSSIADTDVIVKQSSIWTTKWALFSTLKSVLKTYFDPIYAKYLGDADFYQYSLSRTVVSNNLTITVLNYAGATPSSTAPIKYKDANGVIRTISSALSVTFNAWTNYLNAGSAELATKEIDYFGMFQWNTTTSATNLLVTRFSSARTMADITNSNTNEKGAMWIVNYNSTDWVINIGRFNAILSAGAGYTWSIPATSDIRNYYTTDADPQDWVPTITAGTSTWITNVFSKYGVNWRKIHIEWQINIATPQTTINSISLTLPFSSSTQSWLATQIFDWASAVTSTWNTNFWSIAIQKLWWNFVGFLVIRYNIDYFI